MIRGKSVPQQIAERQAKQLEDILEKLELMRRLPMPLTCPSGAQMRYDSIMGVYHADDTTLTTPHA